MLLLIVLLLTRLPQPLLPQLATSSQRKCYLCKQFTPWWSQAVQMTPSLETSKPFDRQVLLILLGVMGLVSVSNNKRCLKQHAKTRSPL